MKKNTKRTVSVLMTVVLLAVMLLPWISSAELVRAAEHKLYYHYDITLAPDGDRIIITTSTSLAFNASALSGMTAEEIEKQFQKNIDYLGGTWYIRYYIVTNKSNNPKPSYYKEIAKAEFTSGSDHSTHDAPKYLSWDDFNNWFIKGTASIAKSVSSNNVTFTGYDVQHKAYFFTNGDEAGGVFSNLDEYNNGKAWLEYVTDPATVWYRTYNAAADSWSKWADSKTKSLTFNFSDYSKGDKVQCKTVSGLGIESTVKEHIFGGGGEDETDPTTETETETPPPTGKQYKVVTNYFFFKSDGSWEMNTILPAKVDTGYEGDYYLIDAPEVDGYAMRKGYYNPHNTSEFVEKDGEILCDWMVNNDCITFAVLYQQPYYVRTWHFTQENGSFVHHLDWDYKKEVAPGGTYKVDKTSRGPYDIILAGEYTGDPDNPVETEQYVFTVDSSMDVALIYKKIRADYVVEHYWQNADDDGYTLADSETMQGVIGDLPDYTYKEYTGFTKNPDKAVISDAISEDDSTVVKLYYDRNVHAVALDKGTGIQSVTGAGAYRYGQTVNISASVGPGYNWEKWDGLSSSISESFIMPDNDLTYKACASPKSFAVTFIGNGGTADPVSRVVTYDSTNWNTGAVTGKRLGYDIGGWYTQANEPGGTPSGEKVFDAGGNAVKGTYWSDNGSSAVWKGLSDLTVYAHWLPKTFTMYFNYNIPSNADKFTLKGDDIKQKEVAYKEKIGSMPSPTLAGYTFQRWSKTEDKTSPDVKENDLYEILDDSTVYAQWGPAWYTIVYDTEGGSWKKNVPANPDIAGYYEDITIYAPERTGYDFTGWNIESMDSFTHVLDGTVSNETSAKNVASGKASAVFKGLRGDNGEVRFTAQWAATPFSITYNLNGTADPGNCRTTFYLMSHESN